MTDQDRRAEPRSATNGRVEPASASDWQALRRRAEARLPTALSAGDVDALSPDAARQLLHELRVHQIELEMQNEELRESQVALDEVRARYFELYDLAPVGYCTVSQQGLIMQANLSAASLLGTTRSALVQQALTRFIHKDDGDDYYLLRKKLVDSGDAQSCELRMLKTDGAQIWVHLAATVAHDVHGGFELRAVLSDITERKQAELALRDSGERYRDLFNSIDEGFCIIEMIFDASGTPVDYLYLEVNPSFEKQSGLHGAAGKRIRELVPHLEAHWFEVYGKVALTGEPIRFADRVVALDGRWFDLYAFRIGGRESRKVAVLFSDTTESKRVETELRQAKLAAEKANLAKSEFLSSMSHELRTPLNAILGFAQLIESGTPPPAPVQKRNIDQILKAGWYLLDLINEILDLAVIESGKLSLSMEVVSLAEVLRECAAMVESQAQQHGIGVTFTPLEAPCFVSGDHTRVKQVLINLLSNAIKYNKAGGTVIVTCGLRPADRVRISIHDTGVGLGPEQLAHLFQPFNRLGQQAGEQEGTGIGLVVSKRLVELMDGVMGVESTAGEGSVFWVELKQTTEPQPADIPAGVTSHAPAQVRANAQVHTLLYVEDNPANLALVEALVARRADMRLLTATDGHRGIAMACAARPDVILMDIHLPGLSGTEALRILADDPATAHIPVIALSANAMPRDIDAGLKAGFFRYLTKPIKVVETMESLDLALRLASNRNEGRG